MNKKAVSRGTAYNFFRLPVVRQSGRSRFRRLQQENKSFTFANMAGAVNFAFDNFGLSLETDEVPASLSAETVLQDQ
ncbi:hypothetical protein SprV_0100170500 [Sparganum proliferum]